MRGRKRFKPVISGADEGMADILPGIVVNCPAGENEKAVPSADSPAVSALAGERSF
jgi:hypothetical protein